MSDLDQEAASRRDLNELGKSLRERMDANKEMTGERLARIEALLMQVDARALAEAEDRGRTNARLEMLEKQQVEDRRRQDADRAAAEERIAGVEAEGQKRSDAQDLKIWGLILAIVALLGGLFKALTGGHP